MTQLTQPDYGLKFAYMLLFYNKLKEALSTWICLSVYLYDYDDTTQYYCIDIAEYLVQ